MEYIPTHANRRAGSASVRGRVPDAVARPNGAAKRLGGIRPARAAGLDRRRAARPARCHPAERGTVSTNADTVYVELSNHTRRAILLSGLDYPYGYLLIDPGGPERILTGVYADDDLLEELRVYFDLPDDTTSAQPRVAT